MENKWYYKILALFKLETTTVHGRINLAGVCIIAMFCLIYAASDVFRHAISAVENIAKTVVLNKDVYHEYESLSVLQAVVPILIGFVLCLLFLAWHEKRKK